VNFWVDYFGLKDWDLDQVHLDEEDGSHASCRSVWRQKVAAISLTKSCETILEDTQKNRQATIRRAAFHEVCELLLAEVRRAAEDRFVTEDQIESAIHGVISRLTNTVYKESL
jgi:hypothetical protein